MANNTKPNPITPEMCEPLWSPEMTEFGIKMQSGYGKLTHAATQLAREQFATNFVQKERPDWRRIFMTEMG